MLCVCMCVSCCCVFYLPAQVVCVDMCLYYTVAVHAFTVVSQTRLSMNETVRVCLFVCVCECVCVCVSAVCMRM